MNIAPPGCAGLRHRRSRVIASSLCCGENWLILVDVRELSRNSTVIYPCQIVFRLRARVSPISTEEGVGGWRKKICVRYPKAIHGCHAAGCVHIIYNNNNMWIHFRLHYCSVFVLNFANGTWALSDPIEIKSNPCKIFRSVFRRSPTFMLAFSSELREFGPDVRTLLNFSVRRSCNIVSRIEQLTKPAGLYSNAFRAIVYRSIKYYVVILLYFNKITLNGIFELFLWKSV